MAEIGVYLISSLLGAGYLFNQRKQQREIAPPYIKTELSPKTGTNVYNSRDLIHAHAEEAKRATVFAEGAKNPIHSNIIPLYFNSLWSTDDPAKIPNKGYDRTMIYRVINNLDEQAVEQINAKARLVVNNIANNQQPEWGIMMDRPVHSRAADLNPLNQIGGALTEKEDFTHNNMVPFFGSSITQDLRTDNRAKDGALELFTGQFKLNLPQKTEQPLRFEPVKDLTNIYGSHEQRDMTRYTPSTLGKKNNVTLTAEDNMLVGPGLNKGFTAAPSGGFHDPFRILPKPIEQLRMDPVVESESITNTAKSAPVSKRALISQGYKNRPDLLIENLNGERNFRTVGASTGSTLRPTQILRTPHRSHSKMYIAPAKAQIDKNRIKPKVKPSRRVNLNHSSFRNAGTIVKATTDYGKKSCTNKETNRARNKQANNAANIAGPKKNTNATKDAMRKTRKQFYTENAKVYGNVHAQQAQALPVAFSTARTTIKETTLNPAPAGLIAGPKGGVTYDPNEKARVTVKQTTLSSGIPGALAGPKGGVAYDPADKSRVTVKQTTLSSGIPGALAGPKGGVTYDPADKARVTMKQTTLSSGVPGALAGPKGGVTYDPADKARVTIKQTTLSSGVPGALAGPKGGVTYDPADKARVTVKQTTLSPSMPGALLGPKRTIAYDPKDVARVTIKQTTLAPSTPGVLLGPKRTIVYNPDDKARVTIKQTTLVPSTPGVLLGPKRTIVYDPNDKARVTIKQTTLAPSVISGVTTLVKKSVAYDPEDVPYATNKDTTLVENYIPAAISKYKQEKNRTDAENARMNTNKDIISQGRDNLTGGASLGRSNTAPILEHRKNDEDRINKRGHIKTSSFLDGPVKKSMVTSVKNNLLPEEDTRLDVRLLDAFKQNPLTQSLSSAP